MVGALGAGLAALTLRGLYRMIAPRIADDLGSWLAAAPLSFFPAQVVVIAIVGGALLGCVGAGAAFSMERA
jgi:hypothetical protein